MISANDGFGSVVISYGDDEYEGLDGSYRLSGTPRKAIIYDGDGDIVPTRNGWRQYVKIRKDLSQIDSGMTILKNLPSDFLPLDGIFHAAGTVLIKPFPLCKKDDFDNMSNIALHSLLSFSKLFHRKKFFNDNASIIVMSSVASEYGTPGLGYYSAIKSAINSSCRNMAIEFSNRNIRVNAILSGAIKTQMHNKIISKLDSKTINEYEKKHPLGFGETKDITPMVCLLMSNASSWITGALINIDGGYSAFK